MDKVGAAHFRQHIEYVLRDHVLFLALLVGPRRLRSVASGACQRDGVDVVLLGAEQQFRGGPTPRAFYRVVHEVHQRTGMHVAEVLEHRFGRQCFGQNTVRDTTTLSSSPVAMASSAAETLARCASRVVS